MKKIVRTLLHWSWLFVLCLLVGWFGGKAAARLLPPTYQALTIVELNTQSRGGGIVKPVTAYAALLTSDSVMNTILKKYPDLDRLTFTTKQLVVTPVLTSETIEIEVTLPGAKEAASIANDLAGLLVAQQNAYIESELDQEVKILQGRITNEQNTINHLNQQIIQTPASSTATIQLYQSQITQQQNLQTRDITSLQTLQANQQLNGAPLSVVQLATPPTKPASLIGQIPIAPVILLLVVLLGVACVISIEQRAGRIYEINALQQKAALPVLGSLRWVRASPEEVTLDTFCKSRNPYTEDCKIMMADILFHAEEANARILAITAIKSNSGSSTIASQLAALLAQSKRRVLLIDGNLYRPTQHARLGVSNEGGLAKVLEESRFAKVQANSENNHANYALNQQNSSDVNAREVAGAVMFAGDRGPAEIPVVKTGKLIKRFDVRNANHASVYEMIELAELFRFLSRYVLPTGIQNLFVLPAGKPNMDPSSLLSMPEMEQFLRWVSRPIDFVVIDCPSLVHAEAHVLGALSDQTYLVVDATKNRVKQVQSTKEKLQSAHVKLSGLIVNKLGRWI